MLKVRLKENIQYFDHDDSDFYIQGKEVKELPQKHLRSYSVKLFLFTGRLEVVEGSIKFMYKSARVFLDETGLYGKECDKYFTKDLEMDTITFVDVNKIPEQAFNALNDIQGITKEEPKEEPVVDLKEDEEPEEISIEEEPKPKKKRVRKKK